MDKVSPFLPKLMDCTACAHLAFLTKEGMLLCYGIKYLLKRGKRGMVIKNKIQK